MKNVKILAVKGYEILDSRGNPTVAAKVILDDMSEGFAIAPSGASTGEFEAHEKRDNDSRYNGMGVKGVAADIEIVISPKLSQIVAPTQEKIDNELIEIDGTPNKSRLGANALLAVSLAFAKAKAKSQMLPLYRYLGGINASILPRPMMNILNGGAHAGNNIDIQEFMITPVKYDSFSENLRKCTEIYHSLRKILKEKGLSTAVGDEGGFAPDLESDEEALKLIVSAIEKAGYTTDEIKIALDIASSEWCKNGEYILPKRNIKADRQYLASYYTDLINRYPIISLEDPCGENDWDFWSELTTQIGGRVQLVGDDLFVTNKKRLIAGVQKNAANAILIKPNQIGTLTETMHVIECAKQNGYKTVISHRSGESEDTTIADLAVAINAGQIKTGAPARTDRVSKYNRLLMIENEIKSLR